MPAVTRRDRVAVDAVSGWKFTLCLRNGVPANVL